MTDEVFQYINPDLVQEGPPGWLIIVERPFTPGKVQMELWFAGISHHEAAIDAVRGRVSDAASIRAPHVKVEPSQRRLSESYPWVVAFAFGLLHGFGFAGALKEIGLPQSDIPLALFTFNLGVEAGQLMFVGAVLLGFKAVKSLFDFPVRAWRVAAAYVIGTTSTVWLVSRVSVF